jgi:hypothetical protein
MEQKIRRLVCRSCKAEIVANDETLTIAHAVPECAWFTALCKQQGERGAPRIAMLDETGREVK